MTAPCTPAADFRTDNPRKDGWTPPLVAQFLETLSSGGNVAAAARACGRSAPGAYALRRRYPHIALAWEAARHLAREVLFDTLLEYSFEGETHTTVKNGEETRRTRRNYRLGLGMLEKFDRTPPSEPAKLVMRHFDDVIAMIGEGASSGDFAAWSKGLRDEANLTLLRNLRLLPEKSAENAAENPDGFDVWKDAVGQWWTNLPPRDDDGAIERGKFGDPDYCRTLNEEEEAAAKARAAAETQAARDPAKLARGLALRDAWLGAGAPDEEVKGEGDAAMEALTAAIADGAPIEIKSMDGLATNPRLEARISSALYSRRACRAPTSHERHVVFR